MRLFLISNLIVNYSKKNNILVAIIKCIFSEISFIEYIEYIEYMEYMERRCLPPGPP